MEGQPRGIELSAACISLRCRCGEVGAVSERCVTSDAGVGFPYLSGSRGESDETGCRI